MVGPGAPSPLAGTCNGYVTAVNSVGQWKGNEA